MKPTDLQVNVFEIPNAGRTIQGTLPEEWIEESVLPAYRVRSPLTLKLDVQPVGDNALVRGEASLTLEFDCSRTLEVATAEIKTSFAELFVPGQKHHIKLDEGEELSSEDLLDEPWVIEDGLIDLEALVREHIVLAQDPYPVSAAAKQGGVANPDAPVWSSSSNEVDPRWASLKNLKLD